MKSKKQTLIAQSLMESEFFALTVAGDEVKWLSCFLRDLSLKELQGAITIYCDNQAMSVVATIIHRKETNYSSEAWLFE